MSIGVDDLQRCCDSAFRRFWKESCGEIPYDPTSKVDQALSICFAHAFVAGFSLGVEITDRA
jgi:hypothetical protein